MAPKRASVNSPSARLTTASCLPTCPNTSRMMAARYSTAAPTSKPIPPADSPAPLRAITAAFTMSGTNIAILSTPNYGSQGNPRSPFNALQIVPIDVTPVLSNPSYASGQFHFFLNGATNSTYIILASTNLVNWFPVSTNKAPAQVTNSPPANTPHRFYRAQFQ